MRQLSLVLPLALSVACSKAVVVPEPPLAPIIQSFTAARSFAAR